MRKLEPLFVDIDFHDAFYKACEMNYNKLTVYLRSWDEKVIKIIFSDVVQFSYRLGDIVEGLYVDRNESHFLDEALALQYDDIPSEHPYKLYRIVDIYDFTFFKVVAGNINVQILPNKKEGSL